MHLTCHTHQKSLTVGGEDGPYDAFSDDGNSDYDDDSFGRGEGGRWALISERERRRVQKKMRERKGIDELMGDEEVRIVMGGGKGIN